MSTGTSNFAVMHHLFSLFLSLSVALSLLVSLHLFLDDNYDQPHDDKVPEDPLDV